MHQKYKRRIKMFSDSRAKFFSDVNVTPVWVIHLKLESSENKPRVALRTCVVTSTPNCKRHHHQLTGILAREVPRLNGARGGQETRLAPPCSNLKSFGRNCTVLKKVLATLLGLSGALQWFGARDIVPLAPLVTVTTLLLGCAITEQL